jgi:hypothetical protein
MGTAGIANSSITLALAGGRCVVKGEVTFVGEILM